MEGVNNSGRLQMATPPIKTKCHLLFKLEIEDWHPHSCWKTSKASASPSPPHRRPESPSVQAHLVGTVLPTLTSCYPRRLCKVHSVSIPPQLIRKLRQKGG